jgi:hypothetical protein
MVYTSPHSHFGPNAGNTHMDNLLFLQTTGTKRFKVVDDKFCKLNLWDRIKWSFSDEYRGSVKSQVNDGIQRMFSNMTYQADKKDEYIFLFRERLAPLSQNLFVRSGIKTTNFYRDMSAAIIRDQQGARSGEPQEFWDKFSESQIAEWLGIHSHRNHFGTSGSYITHDLSRRRVGIFKPTVESPHGLHNPHWGIRLRNFIMSWLPFINKDRCIVEDLGSKNEEFASRLSSLLGWNSIPHAREVDFSSPSFARSNFSEKGSFQLFVDNAEDGYARFKKIPRNAAEANEKISLESFKKFALIEFVICNIDTNPGNMLFQKNHNTAIPIDSWFSMPTRHPNSHLDTRNLHGWRVFPHAQNVIAKEDAQFIYDRRDVINHLVDEIYDGSEYKDNIKACLQDRIAILVQYANQNKTYENLGNDARSQAGFRPQAQI